MKKEKMVNKLAIVGIILALVFSLGLVYAPDIFSLESSSVSLGYETKLFDKSKVMTIDILMPEEDFDSMLEDALSETYYSCDIVINGTTFQNVGIRPKGNTSLTQIASDDTTDRYSFKVEFDHYNSAQTCYGLDKLALNNLMSDATYMKEYLSYDILNYLGVPSSLYSYASIMVNGEPWGFYLALECVEESFALRNFGNSYGQLYKPDSYGVGGMGNGNENKLENKNQGGFPNRSWNESNTSNTTNNHEVIGNNGMVSDFGGMGQKGGMNGTSDSDLIYIDDDVESYSTIFDSALFDIKKADKNRVITL